MATAWRQRAKGTARRADKLLPALLLVVIAAVTAGCVESSGKKGVPGEEDVALFEAPTELAFAERVTLGSRFDVMVVARRTADEPRVLGGAFSSSDDDVLRVVSSEVVKEGEGDDAIERQRVSVEVTGPGEAYLVATDGEGADFDRILVRGAEPARVELLDGTLLGSVVDARLPERISLVDRRETLFVVAATDRCGGAMLDLGGVVVEPHDPDSTEETPLTTPYLTAVVADAGVWVTNGLLSDAEPLVPRETHLRLSAPGLEEPAVYEVKVVPASAVDEVDVAVASASEGAAVVWGRAYSDDDEVIGLSYDWSGNGRVTLDRSEGPLASVDISFPAEGEPADERPALVTAEVFGTEEDLDLLTLRSESELRTGRVPPLEETAAPSGPSCGGSEDACDPYQAALAFGALLFGRQLKRRKRS